jgi:hypothetical protein
MFRCMFRSFFPIRLELIWSVLADKIFLDAWWWLQAFTLYKNALFMVEFDEESLKSVVIVFFSFHILLVAPNFGKTSQLRTQIETHNVKTSWTSTSHRTTLWFDFHQVVERPTDPTCRISRNTVMRKTQIIMSCRRWKMFMQSAYDEIRLQLAGSIWINQFSFHLTYFWHMGTGLACFSYWFRKGPQ